MPLFKRKSWFPCQTPISELQVASKEQLFYVELTSEVFKQYKDYLQRMHMLRAREWSCKFSGRGSLSYEEALSEEEHHKAMLKKFPENLEPTVAHFIHQKALSLEAAINKVYDSLKPAELTDGKENAQGKAKPAKHPLGRLLIRCWIIENCEHVELSDKRKVWVVQPKLAAQFGLPTQLPEGMTPKPLATSAQAECAASTTGSPKQLVGPSLLELRKPVRKGPRTVEEQSLHLVPGAAKHVIFQVLREHGGVNGLNCADIVKRAVEQHLWPEEEAQKKARQVGGLLSTNPELFARVDKGRYTLGALLPGYWEQLDAASAALEESEDHNKGAVPGSADAVGLAGAPDSAAAAPPEAPGQAPADVSQPASTVQEAADPVAEAERQYLSAQEVAAGIRQCLVKAEEVIEPTRLAVEAEKALLKSPAKRRASDAGLEEGMPQFCLPADLQNYEGDQKDRKALMAWKKARHDAEKEIERKKEEWQKVVRARREAQRREAAAGVRAKEEQLKTVTAAAEALRKQLAGAEKAVLDAHKALTREQAQVEREKVRQVRDAEKEKRRLEALAARKYPIEDQDLLKERRQEALEAGRPAPPTELPSFTVRYDQEEGVRLEQALYVADFLGQFLRSAATYVGPVTKALKLHHLAVYDEALPNTISLAVLDRMLGAGLLEENPSGVPLDGELLDCLYVTMLRFLLDDGEGPMYKLWMNLISEQTWPEVLQRYVLARYKVDESPVPQRVLFLCALLARNTVDDFHCDQHLTLLQFLCDEMLDTERIRELLEKRIDEADDAKRLLREGMAEDKKRLRELQEEEKAERKRKRDADVAKRESMAARRRTIDEMQLEAAKQGKQLDATEVQKLLEEDIAAELQEDMDLDEPSFDLPPELQEYKGDPDDRKAQLLFRQAQQKEQKRLEKERAKWQAEARQQRKEAEVKQRLAAEAEKAKQREKEEAMEMLQKRQDAFEKEVEKYAIRRQPLGLDRSYRAYWCSLAGQRGVLYAQDNDGSWSKCTSGGELETLVDMLDKQGVREAALADALDKREASIVDALRKLERRTHNKTDLSSAPVERVQPGRKGKPTDLRAQSSAQQQPAPEVEVPRSFEAKALEWAGMELIDLSKNAKKAKLPCPTAWASWPDFEKQVQAAGQRQLSGPNADLQGPALDRALIGFMQQRMLDLEAAVFAAAKDGQQDHDDSEVSEGNNDDSAAADDASQASTPHDKVAKPTTNGQETLLSPGALLLKQAEEMEEQEATGSRDKLTFWGSRKLRQLWQNDVSGATTFARLAYCASMVNELGQAFLDALIAAEAKKSAVTRKSQAKTANASKANEMLGVKANDVKKEAVKRKGAAYVQVQPRSRQRT